MMEAGCPQKLIQALEESIAEYAEFPLLQKELSSIPLKGRVHLLAIGKSAYPMALIAQDILQNRNLDYDGYLLTKYGHAGVGLKNMNVLEAGHPLPDQNSLKHSGEILTWLQRLKTEDTLIILLSGGGSALFEYPATGYTLEDIIAMNKVLLHSGLDIAAMNRERTRLSMLKGGKALRYLSCSHVWVFALSDVQGNDPGVIASGPFVPEEGSLRQIPFMVIGDNLGFRRLLHSKLSGSRMVHPEYLSNQADEAAAYLERFVKGNPQPGIHILGVKLQFLEREQARVDAARIWLWSWRYALRDAKTCRPLLLPPTAMIIWMELPVPG